MTENLLWRHFQWYLCIIFYFRWFLFFRQILIVIKKQNAISVDEACSRALQVVRDLRKRYASEEQRRNFAPYKSSAGSSSSKRPRATSWTLRAVCLSSRQQCRVPADSTVDESGLRSRSCWMGLIKIRPDPMTDFSNLGTLETVLLINSNDRELV